MSDESPHAVTLRLLEELAERLPEARGREVLAQRELILRLLAVDEDESVIEVTRDLLRDARSL